MLTKLAAASSDRVKLELAQFSKPEVSFLD